MENHVFLLTPIFSYNVPKAAALVMSVLHTMRLLPPHPHLMTEKHHLSNRPPKAHLMSSSQTLNSTPIDLDRTLAWCIWKLDPRNWSL